MLSTFPALSLTSNIVQFVDFSIKIVSRVAEIHRSSSGLLTEHDELLTCAQSLKQNVGLLSESSLVHNDPQVGESLTDLITSCKTLADQLIGAISTFRVGPKHRIIQSIQKALFAESHATKVEGLVKRMVEVRDALNSHLITTLSISSSKTFSRLQAVADEQIALGMKDELVPIQHLERILDSIKAFDKLKGKGELDLPEGMKQWSEALISNATRGAIVQSELQVLHGLAFSDMKIRLSNIAEAYRKTYDWAYQTKAEHSASIARWLKSGNGVFWVTGKAGSGKSTFMKHIAIKDTTEIFLAEWAGAQKTIITASFFFWNSGSQLQKSQEGLLRTLLFQVLRSRPRLIPIICPERWKEASLGSSIKIEWTHMELLQSLHRFLDQDFRDIAFCFFIDGLDEYSGEPFDLLNLLQHLGRNSSIKMCISSRPWNCFEDTFGEDKSKTYRLEEVNRNDIELYVHGMITKHRNFRQLKLYHPECLNLIDEIVERAQGVFLWVYLVVRSLMRGLMNGDTIHDLQFRLLQFPVELKPYFKHMIDSIEDIYREEMAEFLLIALLADEPYSLMVYHLHKISDITSFIDDALMVRMGLQPYSTRLLPQLARTQKRINARCQDLLVVNFSGGDLADFYTVDFLHRTLYDFLNEPEIVQMLLCTAGRDFEPHQFLCRSLTVMIKSLPVIDDPISAKSSDPPFRSVQNSPPWLNPRLQKLLRYLIHHAKMNEQEKGEPMVQLLDRVEHLLSKYLENWSDTAFWQPLQGESFLDSLLAGGVQIYSARKVLTNSPIVPYTLEGRLKLLSRFIRCKSPISDESSSIVQAVQKMLQQICWNVPAISPSASILLEHPWQEFLHCIYVHRKEASISTKKVWMQLAELLLEFGADPTYTISVAAVQDKMDCRRIFRQVFNEWDYAALDIHLQHKAQADKYQRISQTAKPQNESTHSLFNWLFWK